LKQQKMTFST